MLDPQGLWNEVKEKLSNNLSPATFENSFKDVNVVAKEENGVISVVVPTAFLRQRINTLYYNTINNDIVPKLTTQKLKIIFVLENEIQTKKSVPQPQPKMSIYNLNRNYSFESFVVGESNRNAYLAASKVAENPKSGLFNPLYIFGGVGLGKTHLMQAIGNYISDNDINTKIVYVQAQDYSNDYIKASGSKDFKQFDEKYSDIDILLIDDIQMLSKKPGSQEQFFKLFNDMTNKNKQIVITSDRTPTQLEGFMDRLTSRFSFGLSVDIHQPDYSQRVEILKKKALEKTEKTVPDNVLSFIAEKFSSNVRDLEGALNRVIQFSEWENKEITLENAKQSLDILIKSIKKEDNDYEKCLSVIAGLYNIDVSEIIGVSRKTKISTARQISMYILKTKYELTYSKIGSILNNRDHSTIMSGCNKIENELKTDEELKLAVETILKKL